MIPSRFMFAGVLALVSVPAMASPLEDARNTWLSGDALRAQQLYRGVEQDGDAPERERNEASVELARIAWLVEDDAPGAVTRLSRLIETAPEPCAGARLLGRVMVASGAAARVPERLDGVAQACRQLDPSVATAVVDARIQTASALIGEGRRSALRAALEAWRAAPPLARLSAQGARQQLAIGLMSQDAALALAGWRDFFWLEDTAKPQAFGSSDRAVVRTFERGLRDRANDADVAALAALLVRAGFADEAGRLAAGGRHQATPGLWRSVDAYLAMRTRLAQALLAQDRAFARGGPRDNAAFEPTVLPILRQALAAAGRPVSDDPWPALAEELGLYGALGMTNGFPSLHLGHISTDERLETVQGARRGSVRFVALDNMIANGFSGWIGDGEVGPGGWATDDRIVQVRPRYVQSTSRWLEVALPGPTRDQFIATMETRSRADAGLVDGDRPVFLPGLSDRMRLRAIDAVALQATEDGATPGSPAFIRRFRDLWYTQSVAHSITLHEGRHVLDLVSFPGDRALGNTELEYRAKLSELSLSASTRFALVDIYNRYIGEDAGHAQANARLIGDIVAWMRVHQGEIAGFDAARPVIVQMDLLTDDQLRSLAVERDAAARPNSAAAP